VAKPRRRAKARASSTAVPAPSPDQSVGLEAAFRRIANLLALALTKGESETGKVLTMTAAGYSIAEVAQLLDKQPNTVSAILYKARKASS
jgi:DNA-directed RNA polymerase specialized sigma24 family protein